MFYVTMNFKIILVLSACVLVNGYKCPDYCTCEELFSKNIEDKIIQAKCIQIDGIYNSTNTLSIINKIDLSDTSLSDVSIDFNSFKILFDLDLSHNELSKIPKLNKRITNLTLSHNHLTSSSIKNLPLHLQHLDLSYNEITFLPKDMMRLNRLSKLELAGNPIECNCDTMRVRNWLVTRLIATNVMITCGTPKRFQNLSWLEINENDVCEFQKIKIQDHLIEFDLESMLADAPILNSNSSAEEDSSSESIIVDPPAIPRSTEPTKRNEVSNVTTKKKSEEGMEEVYATSGTAGVIIIILTVFAVYKKHQTGGANIETGADADQLKTIGGLELAKATELVRAIDRKLQSKQTSKLEEDVKPVGDIQDLQETQT